MAKVLRVHFRSRTLEEFARDYLCDLGQKGIFIRTRQLLPPGTPLELELRLADGSPVLVGRGTILYATEELAELELPAGMEIRIEELTPETARIHRSLLARRARREARRGARRFRHTLPGLGSDPALPIFVLPSATGERERGELVRAGRPAGTMAG